MNNANFSSWGNRRNCSLEGKSAIFTAGRGGLVGERCGVETEDAERRQEGSYLCGIGAQEVAPRCVILL